MAFFVEADVKQDLEEVYIHRWIVQWRLGRIYEKRGLKAEAHIGNGFSGSSWESFSIPHSGDTLKSQKPGTKGDGGKKVKKPKLERQLVASETERIGPQWN